MSNQMTTDAITVHELRRRWKPHKQRLEETVGSQDTSIRFHRACSWLASVEENKGREEHDNDLISLWVAFNALYGQWDQQRREPKPDRACWRCFVDTLFKLDQDDHLSGTLVEQKRLVMTLLEDEYLSGFFWQEPSTSRAIKSRNTKRKAQSWYVEKRWKTILDEVLDRVYLMRCQLVHGAATHGGKLNRISLQRCIWMMQHLLPTFMMVWIDRGADEDWGEMCYPPTSLDHHPVSHPRNPR